MTAWDTIAPYLYVLLAIALWWLLVRWLGRRKLLERYHLQAWGPFLLWKTQRGRDVIDRLASHRRFWRSYGDISLILVGSTMVAMIVLLLWEATLVQSAALRANPPSPVEYLGLPGINPVIPVGYGIFALVVAIVLHEFAHGILARIANIKIQSLGVVFLIVPMGAFVEPDEDEMRAMPRRERARLYAAGPATNLVLAVLFAFLFSVTMMTAVVPVHDGVGVVGYSPNSGAQASGMPLSTIITRLNGTPVNSFADFAGAMARVHPNQTIAVQTYNGSNGTYATYPVKLGQDPGTGRPLLGIYAFDVSTEYFHPLSNPDRFGGVVNSVLLYVSLPLRGQVPIQDAELQFYRVQGPLAALPSSVFWVVTNTFYWLFWLNFALGTTNALPALALDGGGLFRDGVEELLSRVRRGMKSDHRERVVADVTLLSTFLVLGLILWQVLGPRI